MLKGLGHADLVFKTALYEKSKISRLLASERIPEFEVNHLEILHPDLEILGGRPVLLAPDHNLLALDQSCWQLRMALNAHLGCV